MIWLITLIGIALAWSCVLFIRDLWDRFRVEVGLVASVLALIGYLVFYADAIHAIGLRNPFSFFTHIGAHRVFVSSGWLALLLAVVYVVRVGVFLRGRRHGHPHTSEVVASLLAFITLELIVLFLIVGFWQVTWYVALLLWVLFTVLLFLRIATMLEDLIAIAAISSNHAMVAAFDHVKHFFSWLTKLLERLAFWRYFPDLKPYVERRRQALHERRLIMEHRSKEDDDEYVLLADGNEQSHHFPARHRDTPPPRRT